MKLLPNLKPLAAFAAIALAGLSVSVVYADPNSPFSYTPDPASPIHGVVFDSNSDNLDAFNFYLIKIEDKLTGDKTLAKPAAVGPTQVVSNPEFLAALQAAIVEAAAISDPLVASNTVRGIISAAIQYKPTQVKAIVKSAVLGSPTNAENAVFAAAHVLPAQAGQAAAGAISGLLTVATASATDYGHAADDAVIAQTRASIQLVAKTAVAATKTVPALTQAASASAVATSMLNSFLADAETASVQLYFDEIARGSLDGVNGFSTATKTGVVTALVDALKTAQAGTHSAVVTEKTVTNFAMGALRSVLANALTTSDGNSYDNIKAALVGNAPLNAALPNLVAQINAGATIQKNLRLGVPSGAVTTFSAGLTTAAQADTLYGYMTGAIQAFRGRAADFTLLALQSPAFSVTHLTVAQQKSVIDAAVTGNSSQAGAIVTKAVNATGNTVLPVDAITAAIPGATELYAGAATLAAVRKVTFVKAAAPTAPEKAAAVAVLNAALTTANTVGYQRAFGDIVSGAAKAKKAADDDLVAAAIATAPSDWAEAIAAAVVVANFKEWLVTDTDPTAGSNAAAAVAAALAKGGATLADSVKLAVKVARNGKLSPASLFDDAVAAAYTNPANSRAILLGAATANPKYAPALLGMLLRLKTGPELDSALLNYAVSTSKRTQLNLEVSYAAAKDAVQYPHELFDMVDHSLLTNKAQSVDIVSAVVAARPEFAHYIARAAAFRNPGAAGRTSGAAITFGHMRSNHDLSLTAGDTAIVSGDDPAAVAAIAAATVDGIKDAKLPGANGTRNAITAAVSGMIRASLAFSDVGTTKTADELALGNKLKKLGLVSSTNYVELNAAGAQTTVHQKGTAGVVTGAVAQTQLGTLADLQKLSTLSAAVITAATKAAREHAFAIAQAAGAAAGAVLKLRSIAAGTPMNAATFSDLDGFKAIGDAVFAGLSAALKLTITADSLKAAAKFGATQYDAGFKGVGAAGIRNYDQNGGSANAVSDVSNF
jgi:hypothetical protein